MCKCVFLESFEFTFNKTLMICDSHINSCLITCLLNDYCKRSVLTHLKYYYKQTHESDEIPTFLLGFLDSLLVKLYLKGLRSIL